MSKTNHHETVKTESESKDRSADGFFFPNEFEKRSGTTDRGKDYEHLYIAKLILELIKSEDVEDFRLSSNDARFGAFDDVVVEIKYKNKKNTEIYTFQLKHGGNNCLLTSSLTSPSSKSGDFSLSKYLKDFHQTIQSMQRPPKLILFTNKPVKVDKESIIVPGDKGEIAVDIYEEKCNDIFTTSSKGRCFVFKEAENEMFFQNLTLYTDQADVSYLEKELLSLFSKLFDCQLPSFQFYKEFIVNWSMKEDKKLKLDKKFLKTQLFLCVSSLMIIPLLNSDEELKKEEKVFKEAVKVFDITLFHKKSCSRLETMWKDGLKGYSLEKEKTEDLIQRHSLQIDNVSYETLKQKDQEVSKLLWILNLCPLLVKSCQQIYKAIQICTPKAIIVLNDSNGYVPTLPAFRTLSDLKVHSSIYEEVVNMFHYTIERQKPELLKHIPEHFSEKLTTDDFLLMVDGPLQIGDPKQNLPECHIERKLSKILIDSQFLKTINCKTIAVICCVKNPDEFHLTMTKIDKYLIGDENNIYFTENEWSEEDFNRFCSTNKSKTIYQFKHFNRKCLEWIRSNIKRGYLSDGFLEVKKFRQEDEYNADSINEALMLNERENSINIICANPGMGKSTLAQSLKKNSSSLIWTVVITARNHAGHFTRHGLDVEKFMEYLANKDVPETLKVFVKQKQLRIIWDGLDEVSDKNLNVILPLVEEVSKRGIKQWLISRNNLKKKLEDYFYVPARHIKEFNEEEQEKYIGSRLKMTSEETSKIITGIRSNIKGYSNTDILGVPLQIYILTDIISKNKSKYLEQLEGIFTLLDLYKSFVEESFKISYLDKKGQNINNELNLREFENEKNYTTRCYKRIAFNLHFRQSYRWNEDKCQSSDHEVERFINNIVQAVGDNYGFIKKAISANDVEFTHNSYGEFFAAWYLFDNNPEMAREVGFIQNDRYKNIRFILDLMLAKDSKASLAVLYKNFSLISQCNNEDLAYKDDIGRTVLELSCAWSKRNDMYLLEDGEHIHFNPMELNKEHNQTLDYNDIVQDFREIVPSQDLFKRQLMIFFPFLIKCYDKHVDGFARRYLPTILYNALKLDDTLLYSCTEDLKLLRTGYIKVAPTVLLLAGIICNSRKILAKVMLREEYHHALVDHPDNVLKDLSLKHNETLTFVLNLKDENGNMPIHHACHKGNFQVVKLFVDKGSKIDIPDSQGLLPISHVCSKIKKRDISLDLLNQLMNDGVNTSDGNNSLPIHWACQNPHGLEIVQHLIDGGAKWNIPDSRGYLPLHYACENQNGEDIVSLLLDRNPESVNIQNLAKKFPIHLASKNRNGYDIVQCLIKKSWEIRHKGDIPDLRGSFEWKIPDSRGYLPLHYACENKNGTDIVSLLLSHDAEAANVPNFKKQLPIHLASKNQNGYHIVQCLIEKSGNIQASDEKQRQPIHNFFKNDNSMAILRSLSMPDGNLNQADKNGVLSMHQVFQNLYENDIINVLDSEGCSPLHYACQLERGHKTVALLVENGGNIHRPDANGLLPIHHACKNVDGFLTVKLLLKNRTQLDVPDSKGMLPLHYACLNINAYHTVKLLLAQGVKTNVPNNEGVLPLHYACKNSNAYCTVQLLLNTMQDFDVCNDTNLLHFALQNRSDFKITKLLLDRNVKLDVPDQNGYLPIHIICKSIWINNTILDMVLQKGAKVDVADAQGMLPIHHACANENGATKVETLLRVKTPQINIKDGNGMLPIHHACMNEQGYSIVPHLLEHGSLIEVPDDHGYYPLHYACMNIRCCYEIVTELIFNWVNLIVYDKSGFLPAHHAFLNKSGHKLVDLFIKQGLYIQSPTRHDKCIDYVGKFKTLDEVKQSIIITKSQLNTFK